MNTEPLPASLVTVTTPARHEALAKEAMDKGRAVHRRLDGGAGSLGMRGPPR